MLINMHHVREPFRLFNQIYGICINQVHVKSRAPEEGAANAIIAKANTAHANAAKAIMAHAIIANANAAKAVMAYANAANATMPKAITAHANAETHFSLSEPVEIFKHGAQVRHIFLIGNGGIFC